MLRQMRQIMEGLYKWENFREHPEACNWIEEISRARRDLRELFEDSPSLKAIAQDKDTLQKVWKLSVRALLGWLKLPPNKALVVSHFKDKLYLIASGLLKCGRSGQSYLDKV